MGPDLLIRKAIMGTEIVRSKSKFPSGARRSLGLEGALVTAFG